MKEEPVNFLSGMLKIEGLLSVPERKGYHPASIICHPHPQFGGDMHNNVVALLARALQDEGVVTLRFNFRGVGSSEGAYAEGEGEIEDVHGGIDFLKEQPFVDRKRMFAIGYSFGAWVCLRAAHQRKDVAGLIGISPPIAMYDFSFLEKDSRPKLLLMGDRDFVCPVQSATKLYGMIPEPKEMKVIGGGDHFLWGLEEEAGRSVCQFIKGWAINNRQDCLM